MDNVHVPLTGNVLMLPPPATGVGVVSYAQGANPITLQSGRVYSAAVGTAVTVPWFDAQVLISNGWTMFGWGTGPTTSRPTGVNLTQGFMYYDTTVGAMVCYDGVTWRNASGTAV